MAVCTISPQRAQQYSEQTVDVRSTPLWATAACLTANTIMAAHGAREGNATLTVNVLGGKVDPLKW